MAADEEVLVVDDALVGSALDAGGELVVGDAEVVAGRGGAVAGWGPVDFAGAGGAAEGHGGV